MDTIIDYFTELAKYFGSNDPMVVVVAALLAFLFLTLVVMSLRTTIVRNRESDRTAAILHRVEILEKSMQNFRDDMERSVEQFKGLTQEVRSDVTKLKKGGGGGDEGGGALGGGGTGSTGGHSGPSGRGASEASVSSKEVSKETSSALVSRGLEKSRTSFLGRIRALFSDSGKVDESGLDDLEELLITSDVGAKCAARLVKQVREQVATEKGLNESELKGLLKSEILSSLVSVDDDHRIYTASESPLIVLVVGVNGVGKTTTVAKLASKWSSAGKRVVMVAADTFRAAAVQQLEEWGRRLDVPVVSGAEGSKPSTVVFDGMTRAKDGAADVVIIDTAGRLHNKSNLMQELEGVRNAVNRHFPGAPHETVLVLDGVSGQNALMQAREFNQATPLTGIVVTKLDGTPKGGIVVAISQELSLPVYYIGVGERAEDLVPFSPDEFVSGLLGDTVRAESRSSGTGGGGSFHPATTGRLDALGGAPGLSLH